MAKRTKQYLKETLVTGHLVTGADFTDLVDSMKATQDAVSDPGASGSATAFISSITQNEEGVLSVQKKNVDFSGYQTKTGMNVYQDNDLQQVGTVEADGSGADISFDITHDMKHFPTVRLMDSNGNEIRPSEAIMEPFSVQHTSNMELKLTLRAAFNTVADSYKYILD